MSSPLTPQQPSSGDPVARLAEQVAALARELAALKQGRFNELIAEGPRTDLNPQRGPRVWLGKQADGRYGLRVYNANGTVAYDYTTP